MDAAYVVAQGVLGGNLRAKARKMLEQSREGWAGRNVGQLGAYPPMIPRLRRMEERETTLQASASEPICCDLD
jgi:hypothetical protein